MANFTQAKRPVRINTPLGSDVLLFQSMNGVEHLGRPFQYDLILASEGHEVNYKDIIGQNVTIVMEKEGKEPRYFNGFVSRFSQTKYEQKLAEYRATVVPWLWFLTRSSDCRIFQNLAIPDIIKQVFQDFGFSDIVDRLQGSYRQWSYCVQYRETAFNFVSRLMEEEGIYYFFKHEDGKHSLVLCDSPGSHKQFAGYENLLYRPTAAQVQETLSTWAVQHEVQSGIYATNNFDFTNPKAISPSNSFQDRGHAQSQLEQFDYLGEQSPFDEYYTSDRSPAPSDDERYSKLRLEELQAEHEMYSGEGDARGICTGVRFVLKGHPRKDFEKEYLTTGADYQIQCNPFESKSDPGQGFKYNARMTAVLLDTQFRAPRVTHKPIVHGPQTATVVGPAGQKIYTDPTGYGMVKVQFHWDRVGTNDENSSCWMRVSQAWASKNWGDMALPHVGDEVIVECLEGDPDRPIITGRVYNATNMPPLDLPANQDKRILRDDFGNEIIFDATTGNEHLRLHSPHHNSFLDLGKSVQSFTNSDTRTIQIGNYTSVTAGLSQTFVGGVNVSATGGIATQINLGMVYNATLGCVHNFTCGYQFNLSAGPIRTISSSDVNSISNENNIVSAANTLCLVGGNKVTPGTIDNTSIINASEESIFMSVGESAHVDDSMSTQAKIALFLSLFFAAGGAAGAVIACAEASNSSNYDSTNGQINQDNPWIPAGASMLSAVLSLIATGYFASEIAKPIDVTAAEHKFPKGSIELAGDKGTINIASEDKIKITQQQVTGRPLPPNSPVGPIISGETTIVLKNDGNIEITSTKGIKLTCQSDLELVGGNIKFSGNNIASDGPMKLCGGALEVQAPPKPPPPLKPPKPKHPTRPLPPTPPGKP